jgi:serine/threonine protein kinase
MARPNNSSLLNSLERPRFLCDSKFTQLITSGDFTIKSLRSRNPAAASLGEGAFGKTVSAELTVQPKEILLNQGFPGIVANNARKDLSCTAALKISLQAARISEIGIPDDTLVETAVYSRIAQKENVAKALFVKLSKTEIKTVMEHYITNLHSLTEKIGLLKRNLLRAVFYQLAHGLHEFHSTDILHKDLKLQNVLLGHDGRVFITDFGLSNFCIVDSAEPKLFYYRNTTATIVPPERFSYTPIGKSYDIWGLGVCLANLAYKSTHGFQMYDFYAYTFGGYSWDDYFQMRAISNMAWVHTEYSKKTEEIVKAVNLIDPQCGDLLGRILVNDPTQRLTSAEILAHPWFAGLTLEEAVRTTQTELGMNPRMSQTILSIFDDIKKYDPVTKTYITNAPNVNTSSDKFFQIKPSVTSSGTFVLWSGELNTTMKLIVFDWLLEATQADYFKVSMYSYLHAIELLERILEKKQILRRELQLYTTLALHIAVKISPIDGQHTEAEVKDLVKLGDNSYTKDAVYDNEIKFISLLQGDLFPQRGGFVDLFLNTYMKGIQEDKKEFRFFLAVLCYLSLDKIASFTEFFNVVDKIYVESGEPVTPMPKTVLQADREKIIRDSITYNIARLTTPMKYTIGYVFGANPNINRILRMPSAFRTLTPDIRLKSRVKQLPVAHV